MRDILLRLRTTIINILSLTKDILNTLYSSPNRTIEAFYLEASISLIKDLNITMYYTTLVDIINEFKSRLRIVYKGNK